MNPSYSGILLVDKPPQVTSFRIVGWLRRLLNVKKIGHAGTLDPFATGLMVMLVGRDYTKLSDEFLTSDKEYIATMHLGQTTDTYDCEGTVLTSSDIVPSLDEVETAIARFQGWQEQIPPMFSAKKQGGKKLYELARQGKEVVRPPAKVYMEIQLLDYSYPSLKLKVKCSKGTYIRSLGYDLGEVLVCGAHLSALRRTRSGHFAVQDCLDGTLLQEGAIPAEEVAKRLLK